MRFLCKIFGCKPWITEYDKATEANNAKCLRCGADI